MTEPVFAHEPHSFVGMEEPDEPAMDPRWSRDHGRTHCSEEETRRGMMNEEWMSSTAPTLAKAKDGRPVVLGTGGSVKPAHPLVSGSRPDRDPHT